MAGVRFIAFHPTVTVSADPQTIIQLTAAAQHGVYIEEVEIVFDPNGATAAYFATMELIVQSGAAGTGTALVKGTNLNKIRDDNETLQLTGKHTMTIEEGTQGPAKETMRVNILSSGFTRANWRFTGRNKLKIPGGTKLGVRFNPDGGETPKIDVKIIGEE